MMLLARISAGMLLWAFGFSLLYALHGLGCTQGWGVSLLGGSLFRWILVVPWLLLIGGGAYLIWWTRAMGAGFARRVALLCSVAGLVGTIVTGAPVVITSACLPPPMTIDEGRR